MSSKCISLGYKLKLICRGKNEFQKEGGGGNYKNAQYISLDLSQLNHQGPTPHHRNIVADLGSVPAFTISALADCHSHSLVLILDWLQSTGGICFCVSCHKLRGCSSVANAGW